LVLKAARDLIPTSISADGRQLLFTQADPRTKNDIWLLTNPGPGQGERKAEPMLNGDFNETEGRIVPGAAPRWVAYTSDESGRPEVYVREFKPGGARWVVSSAGGSNPRWRADGAVMAAEIASGASFQSGAQGALQSSFRSAAQLGSHRRRPALPHAGPGGAKYPGSVHGVAQLGVHAAAIALLDRLKKPWISKRLSSF
jgi:hypothetical protein